MLRVTGTFSIKLLMMFSRFLWNDLKLLKMQLHLMCDLSRIETLSGTTTADQTTLNQNNT